MSSIAAGTTTTTGLVYTSDTSGNLVLQTNGTTTALTIDTSQNVTFAGKLTSASSLVLASNGSTTAVTIDANQNVGVGVTPSSWYTTSNTHAIQLPNSALLDYQGTSANYAQNAYLNTSGNWIYKTTAAATQYQQTGGAHYWYNVGSGTAGATISFTQAMTLSNSGNLWLNQTGGVGANGGKMEIYTADNYNGSPNLALNTGANNTGGIYLYFTNAAGTKIGSVTQASSTSVAYNTTSDYRLKENIKPMTGALAKILALNPVTYTWKEDKSDGEGFIAHELQAIIPKAVTGSKDEVDVSGKPNYQSVDNSFLVATLTAAIQELSAQVTTLSAKVTALEAKVA